MARYEEPSEHVPDEHLALVESRLLSIVESYGLTLEPHESCHDSIWERACPLTYKGGKVFAVFRVYLNRLDAGDCYQACGSVVQGADFDFLEAKSEMRDDLDDALADFRRRLDFAKNNHIPPEYLPAQRVWVEERLGGIPERFRGQVPLWQVIKRYEYRRGKERFRVGRSFDGTEESLDIHYEDGMVKEWVTIQAGKIVEAGRFSIMGKMTNIGDS